MKPLRHALDYKGTYMDMLFRIGGSTICAALFGSWLYFDKASYMEYGWLIVIALGIVFTGLANISKGLN